MTLSVLLPFIHGTLNTDYFCPMVATSCRSNKYPLTESHLDEMVDHEGSDAGSPPLGMDQQEGDIGLVVLHVWHHETKANHNFFIEDNHAEVWVLQTL